MQIPAASCCLPREFYERDTAVVACDLIGKAFVLRVGDRSSSRRWTGGLIVETEAYLAEGDQASHSSRGQTRSNASMFGRPGTLYVYPIHAKHCLNLVCESEGRGAAVLIRALEPIWSISDMLSRRGQQDIRRCSSGPGMICQALGVDRGHDGVDVIRDPDWRIADVGISHPTVSQSGRIGVSQDSCRPLRFFADGNRYVSGRASDHVRPRKHAFGG